MTLDPLARRYADESYTGLEQKIISEQQKKAREIVGYGASQGALFSGPFASALAENLSETARLLINVRTETLLSAYEKSSTLLDESAVQGLTGEISNFAQIREHFAIGYLWQLLDQKFGAPVPAGARIELQGRIENAVRIALADVLRNLRLKHLESKLSRRNKPDVYRTTSDKQWDVFISHASEDKEEFVRPLAEELQKGGIKVWYDESSLKVGDSLRESIDHGLANSNFGIVVLSHNFFSKRWPRQELDALVSREIGGTAHLRVILPIWHKITADAVAAYSPILAGRKAAKSSDGLADVVRQLRESMGLVP